MEENARRGAVKVAATTKGLFEGYEEVDKYLKQEVAGKLGVEGDKVTKIEQNKNKLNMKELL